MSQIKKTILISATALCGVCVFLVLLMQQPEPVNMIRQLQDARRFLERKQYERARDAAAGIPEGSLQHSAALLILGEVATVSEENLDKAIEIYARVPSDKSEQDLLARLASGEIYLEQKKLTLAYNSFAYALAHRPDATHTINRMAFVLGLAGRRFEAAPFSIELIRRDEFSVEMLAVTGEQSAVVGLTEDLRLKEASPDDPLLNLANCRFALQDNRLDDARLFINATLASDPNLVEARVREGELLLAEKDYRGFASWHRDFAKLMSNHPDFWQLCGRFAELIEDKDVAVRCYWENMRIDCNSRLACFRLAQILPQIGRDSEAAIYADRASRLQELGTALLRIFGNNKSMPHITQAAELSMSLGRYWEAWGWARVALLIEPRLEWAIRMRSECESHFSDSLPQTLPGQEVTKIDLSSFPLPDADTWIRRASEIASRSNADVTRNSIQFSNDSIRLKADFSYFCSPDLSTPGGRMFEFTGGGMAAIDFDLDTRPDIYWVQGCEWPPNPQNTTLVDRLMRNVGVEMQDVTSECGIVEEQFGQGVNQGDVNQDGFPDLFVANTHQNRLFLNLGDGTFVETTHESGLTDAPAVWTTSCMIADLNSDQIPDLFEVNYAIGDDVFSKICDRDGVTRSCLPTIFEAAPDRLWLGDGEGRFRNASEESGIAVREGRGLGIVAFTPGDTPGPLAVFIANDMTENFLWQRTSVTPQTSVPVFTETGLVGGVAYGAEGTSQASMGVGAGDMDGNGMLDLFVTNFHNESNNVYLQQSPGVFLDEAVRTDAREISYSLLGFGCQCLDADIDGWLDVVITNGHVDDFRHEGTDYQMPPQLLQNIGGQRFRELPAASLGSFFEGKYLGRGLAVTDWNNDLKSDFCVSHLDSPSALVTNSTVTDNTAVGFWLVAKNTDRSAIGAIVKVQSGSRTHTTQVVGGSGYESSNDRKLIIGLGPEGGVERVEVAWPDGMLQSFNGVEVNQTYILVQGSENAFPVPAAAF